MFSRNTSMLSADLSSGGAADLFCAARGWYYFAVAVGAAIPGGTLIHG